MATKIKRPKFETNNKCKHIGDKKHREQQKRTTSSRVTARKSLIDCSNLECSGIYNALLEALKPLVSAILTARKSHDVHMY